VYAHKPTSRHLISLAALLMVVITLLTLPVYHGAISYGNRVKVGAEIYNPFGWKLAGVYSMIVFAYDDTTNKFVLADGYTYVRNWAEKAWWCLTCYAEILDTMGYTYPNKLYNRANWKMGSWNAEWTGYNEINIATTYTPNYIYVDYWVYVYGEGRYGEAIFDWIPVIIEFIV